MSELNEFLKKYPAPKIVVSSTLIEGAVVCINPVPTIFGPEIHCHKDSYERVRLAQRNKQ